MMQIILGGQEKEIYMRCL